MTRPTSDRDADLVVVNTCSVRERAEDKLYTRLGEIREMARETGRDPIVAVTGCVAQQEGAALLARSPGIIDLIVGTQRVKMLPVLVQQKVESRALPAIDVSTPYDEPSFPLGITRRTDAGQGLRDDHRGLQRFLQLLRRAVHPRARADAAEGRDSGRSRASRGKRLQGSAAPRADREPLPGAGRSGRAISRHCSRRSTRSPASSASASPARIRGTRRDRLIAAVRSLPKVCKHLHLPVQSGSTPRAPA